MKKIDVSRPVVSFNPKPIIIDTNLANQKKKEKASLMEQKKEGLKS